jgi:ketosteroid isomerase-like protein
MTLGSAKTTEEVLGHHVRAIVSQDVESIMTDYAEDAVVFSPGGAARGKDAIRANMPTALAMFSPDVVANLKTLKQEVHGDYAYVLWCSNPAIPFGTDTFCVRNGKIVMQSFAVQTGQ